MPFDLYRRISDRDAQAIAVYLRSMKPVRNRVPKSVYAKPLPASYGPPLSSIAETAADDRVAYGAYLAGPLGRCIECHTPSSDGQPDYDSMLGAGGADFTGPWGTTTSGNLTPDPETGLGEMSDEQIKKMITGGLRPNLTQIGPPMAHAFYKRLKPSDLSAIVAYLRTLKPIRNFVDK